MTPQDLDTKENIGIWFGSELLASKNSSSYENAENVEVERQSVSGIKEGESVSGFSARAFLTNGMMNTVAEAWRTVPVLWGESSAKLRNLQGRIFRWWL